MRQYRRWLWLIAPVVALAGSSGDAAADEPFAPPGGMAAFAGELVQKYGYMFDAARLEVLDDLHRRIREGEARLQKRPDEAASRKAASDQMMEAARGLFEELERYPHLVRVRLQDGRAVTEQSNPVPLPSDVGAVLLKIDAGRGAGRCVTATYDLSQRRDPIALEIEPRGTIWLLVGLAEVPAGSNAMAVELKRSTGAAVPLIFHVTAPERAQLRIRILSHDTGEPAPAMVCLIYKVDGSERRPPNIVDFGEQFDNLGRASAHRHAALPGRLGGRLWWCVGGPFDMLVPPGEWDIIIRRGLEHVPVFDTFTTRPGETFEKTYTPRRWVDMPKQGWYSGDLHVHCRVTSEEDARRLMTWVRAEDVHVASILKMGDFQRTWFQQRGFGPQYRVMDGNWALVPGQECPRTHSNGFGHVIAVNTRSMVRDVDRYWLYDWVIDTVHGQGGLFGYAHALQTHPAYQRGMSLWIPRNRVDFFEILQLAQLGTELYYDFLNLGFKMTASAGSDVPWQGTVGEVRTYAYVGEGGFSVDAWYDAVARGRTFVTNGPMIDFRVDDSLPGDEIVLREPRKVRIRARAWGDSDYFVPTKLQIIQHGDVIRESVPTPDHPAEALMDFELPAGKSGFWIAARAEGNDGSIAHTTPVYVLPPRGRFWKLEAVDGLLAKRRANLEDVKKLIADARRQVESGEVGEEVWHNVETIRQMAAQGDELLKRIAAAHEFYTELELMQLVEQAQTAPAR